MLRFLLFLVKIEILYYRKITAQYFQHYLLPLEIRKFSFYKTLT